MIFVRNAHRVTAVLLTLIVAVIVGGLANAAGSAHAAGRMYYFQGTGDTVAAPEYIEKYAADSGFELVDMSTDEGWEADFAPVQGTNTADQSIASGVALASPSIQQDLADGKRVVGTGYSLGALAMGQLGKDLAEAGVDISNMKFTLISDGTTKDTGALVVLERIKPVADVMKMIGITPGPREVPSVGQWEFICIAGDGVCDVPDVLRDPVGALDALVGYFVKHGGADPKYNYWNTDEMESTTYVDGNVTTVVYHAPRAITRAVELITGSVELSERVDAVLEKLITSSGDPGQAKTYKTIPETIRDVASIFDPEAPLLPTTKEEVPVFVGEVAEELVRGAAPKVGGIVGEAVGTAVGTQLAGPAGGAIGGEFGQQAGEAAGTVFGEAAAPIVGDAMEVGTQALIENSTAPLNGFVQKHLPGAPAIPTQPIVPNVQQLATQFGLAG